MFAASGGTSCVVSSWLVWSDASDGTEIGKSWAGIRTEERCQHKNGRSSRCTHDHTCLFTACSSVTVSSAAVLKLALSACNRCAMWSTRGCHCARRPRGIHSLVLGSTRAVVSVVTALHRNARQRGRGRKGTTCEVDDTSAHHTATFTTRH